MSRTTRASGGRRARASAAVLGVGGALSVLGLAPAGAAPAQAAESSTAAAVTYRYIDLGLLGVNPSREGGGYALAAGVNEQRQVAGWSTSSKVGGTRGFVWQQGRLIDVGSLTRGGGGGNSAMYAINDNGVAAGWTNPASQFEPGKAATFRNGKLTLLPGWGPRSSSEVLAINNRGQAVGSASRDVNSVSQARERAVLWSGGVMRDLGTLGGTTQSRYGTEAIARDINEVGQVVGDALATGDNPWRAFLWENGKMRDLGTLGSTFEGTTAIAINDRGVAVGGSALPDRQVGASHAVRWSPDGRIQDLGALGTGPLVSSYAQDINNSGVIVGQSRDDDLLDKAFVWRNGSMKQLDTLVTNLPKGRTLATAEGINDKGVIVGRSCLGGCGVFTSLNAFSRAFMLIPNS